ncbi:MAG: hypothetical protein OEV94_10365 [Deltaproteobacteria bacterium]|nr:hypothetical protein [Deltaproteobacteria bacterium]
MSLSIQGFRGQGFAQGGLAAGARRNKAPPPEESKSLPVGAGAGGGQERSEQGRSLLAALDQAVQSAESASVLAGLALTQLRRCRGWVEELHRMAQAAENEPLPAEQRDPSVLLACLAAAAEDTRFGPRRMMDGSQGVEGMAVGEGFRFVRAEAFTRPSPPEGYAVAVSRLPRRALVRGHLPAGPFRLELGEGGQLVRVEVPPGLPPEAVVARLSEVFRRAGLDLWAGASSGGFFIAHRRMGRQHGFSAVSDPPQVLGSTGGLYMGQDIQGTLDGLPAEGQGCFLFGPTGTHLEGLVAAWQPPPDPGDPHLPRPEVLPEGRLVLVRNGMVFHPGSHLGPPVWVHLPSVHPRHLGRGVDVPEGYDSLAAIRLDNPPAARAAAEVAQAALTELAGHQTVLETMASGPLLQTLQNYQVRAENVVAAQGALLHADLARSMAEHLRRQIPVQGSEAVEALAQHGGGPMLRLLNRDPGEGGLSALSLKELRPSKEGL